MFAPKLLTPPLLALSLCLASPCSAQITGPAVEAKLESSRPSLAEAPASERTSAALRFDVVIGDQEHRLQRLLEQMTLAEKVGQLVQVYPEGDVISDKLAAQIRNGEVGSIFYPGNAEVVRKAQEIAGKESRLGVPLIIGRDVVHGFRTVFPIPLGQAASWNPELVEQAAKIAAREARSEGIGWTFAPMVDICRDARWGRIAETLGEDAKLSGDLAAAMTRGFQQEQDGKIYGLAACAKHYVGYGLAEGGRDYNRASLSQADLHNIYLPPFKAALDAGCRTMMTTFSEVNGVPGTAHQSLINGVLKGDWRFRGLVVSDWASITEMIAHGYCADAEEAAELAFSSGVDMDMCSVAYADHLVDLVQRGVVSESSLDDAVRRVLRLKATVVAPSEADRAEKLTSPANLEVARKVAQQSIVLLKNDNLLPLQSTDIRKLAVIGPMADAPLHQLGCWALDGKPNDTVTPLGHLRERFAGKAEVLYAQGSTGLLGEQEANIDEAVEIAKQADTVVLFVGENSLLSGEARSRAQLTLPGKQSQLVDALAETGKPVVLVVLAGRPLAIGPQVASSGAVLYAWHPGTMGGPAIGDILFGDASPSAKLPVSFPKGVGQVPLYYNHPNTGRPSPANFKSLKQTGEEDLPAEFQYKSHYVDSDPYPLFPFGFGLTYSEFEHKELRLEASQLGENDVLRVQVKLENVGDKAATEVTQLYIRDRVARVVRPVRELKAYRRTHLEPQQSKTLVFELPVAELSYINNQQQRVLEPGEFDIWVGGDSTAELTDTFELLPSDQPVSTPADSRVAG